MPTNTEYSGVISCKDGVISYRAVSVGWAIRLEDIRLIGEYTTANGPYMDDYFLVFITSLENGWYEASFYADGFEKVLEQLTAFLGEPVDAGLCNSAEFKSRIIWPPECAGRELLEVIPPSETSFFKRLFSCVESKIAPSKATRDVFQA